MIEPLAAAFIAGSAGRITRHMPLRSMSKVWSHFSSESRSSGTLWAMPALATMHVERSVPIRRPRRRRARPPWCRARRARGIRRRRPRPLCVGRRLALGLQDVGDDHAVAGLAEGEAGRAADADRAAGDEDEWLHVPPLDWFRSQHHVSRIRAERLADIEARPGRSEEGHRRGDLVGLAEAAERQPSRLRRANPATAPRRAAC